MKLFDTPTADQTRTTRLFPARLKLLVAFVGIAALVLALFGGLGTVNHTDAAWASQDSTTASFTAARLGPVTEFECYDEERGLAETPILNNQVVLEWDPPAGVPPDVPIQYQVSWQESGLLSGSGSVVTEEETHTYTSSGGLLNLGVALQVRPLLHQWEGDPTHQRADAVGLTIISVYLGCRG